MARVKIHQLQLLYYNDGLECCHGPWRIRRALALPGSISAILDDVQRHKEPFLTADSDESHCVSHRRAQHLQDATRDATRLSGIGHARAILG